MLSCVHTFVTFVYFFLANLPRQQKGGAFFLFKGVAGTDKIRRSNSQKAIIFTFFEKSLNALKPLYLKENRAIFIKSQVHMSIDNQIIVVLSIFTRSVRCPIFNI